MQAIIRPIAGLGLVLTLGVTPDAALPAQQAAAAPAPAAAPVSSGVKLSGYLQARETYQKGPGLTGTINRARLTASGSISGDFTWRIQGEFRTGNVGTGNASVSLTDAYIRWTRRDLGLQAGQFKTPFSREYWTSLADIETADRSTVSDSLAPRRDIGVMADYTVHGKATLYAGLFNGEGTNTTANRDSTLLGVARVVVRPIAMLALGVHMARYLGDSTRYGADANFEGRRFTLRAEYAVQSRDSLGGEDDHGWFGLAGFQVDPRIQLVGKYEDFRRDRISLQQQNRAWTAAVNLLLHGAAAKLTLEYLSRKIGYPGVRRGMVLTQVQLRF